MAELCISMAARGFLDIFQKFNSGDGYLYRFHNFRLFDGGLCHRTL